MRSFDWPVLMRVAFQGLRLSPEAFWALTPAELALMLGEGASAAPLTRGGLDDLLRMYPDERNGVRDDRD